MMFNGMYLINEVFEFCGGCNVFVLFKLFVLIVIDEVVFVVNLEVIVIMSVGVICLNELLLSFVCWCVWFVLMVVVCNNLFVIDGDLLMWLLLCIVQGVVVLCEDLDVVCVWWLVC